MPIPSAVVIVVDRLSQGFLGPYGNTVVRTPEFDSLAAEAFVFDHALIADPRLGPAYEALWGLQSPASLPAALAATGVHACLITDEPVVARHPLANDFAERELLEIGEPERAAQDLSDAVLSQVFGAAADWIDTARSPFLLWIHARGMAAAWDAPYDLRAAYADEEDPAPPDFIAVPDRLLPADFDPDDLLGITQAYCGQVAALDACLGMLRTAMAEAPLADSTLLCVLSSRGFPLGEHRRVGGDDAPLYGELIEIPFFLRLPDRAGALGRSPALVQHQDLPATLLAWWGIEASHAAGSHDLLPLARRARLGPPMGRDLGGKRGAGGALAGLVFSRASGPPADPRLELFAKPSDRWEVNEVAARAPRICESLAGLLAETQAESRSAGSRAAGRDAAGRDAAGRDAAGRDATAPLDPALLDPVD